MEYLISIERLDPMNNERKLLRVVHIATRHHEGYRLYTGSVEENAVYLS
jgi:hypothetical protein